MVTVLISRGARGVNDDRAAGLPTTITAAPPAALAAHPKALLVAEGGPTFVLPLAPLTSEADGFTPTWGGVERDGRKPITYLDSIPLRTLSFVCTARTPRAGDAAGQVPIEEDVLAPLVALLATGPKLYLQRMGFTERGAWACTGLKITATARQHGTNLITRASLAFSFLEFANAGTVAKVGPVTGGAVVPPAVPAPAPAAAAPAPAPSSYVVVAGDTLVRIATRFYGVPGRWRDIATANRLPNPDRITVGQRLTIPRP